MATCGCPRQGGCRGAVPPLRVYPQFGAHHPPLLCPPSPSAPLIPPPIASIISPAEGGGGWGWGGAKAAGVSIPIAAPGCCRCGDTGDSQEPGPRCHHHWGGKQSTSHLPRYPPGAGVRRRGGGNRHPKPSPQPPPPPSQRWGASALGWSGEGKLRHGEGESQPLFWGGGKVPGGCCSPPNPSLSQPPQIPPPGSCRAAGCGFARLPHYTQRDCYNSSHPPTRAAQPQITLSSPPPLQKT